MIQRLIQNGDLSNALEVAEQSSSIESQLLRIRILERMGKLDEGWKVADELKKQLDPTDKKFQLFLSVAMVNLYWRQGAVNEAMQCLEQAEFRYKSIGNNPDKTIMAWKGLLLLTKGSLMHDQGDLTGAVSSYMECLAIREVLDDRRDLSVTYNNLGNVYVQLGQLNRAREYYYRSLAIHWELGNSRDIAFAMGNIGVVAHAQGKLEEAASYLNHALSVFENSNFVPGIAEALDFLALINYQNGNLEQSRQQLNRCLQLKHTINNEIQLSQTLFYLMQVTLKQKNMVAANEYLEQLQQFTSGNNARVMLYFHLSKALVLKASNRAISIAKAQQIFLEVSEAPIIDFSLTIFALLNLCEILIVELQQFGNGEVLDELASLLDQLFDIATRQKLFPTLAQVYVFQSKLALLQSKPTEARRLITTAQQLADEHGLANLSVEISSNLDILLDQLDKWQEMIEDNTSLIERMEYVNLEQLVLEMMKQKKANISLRPERPLFFRIRHVANTSIYHRDFQWGHDTSKIDDFLDSLLDSDPIQINTIERIKFEHSTLVIRHLFDLYFIYVFEGQSYSPNRKMDAFIETVQSMATTLKETAIKLPDDVFQIIDAYVTDLIEPSPPVVASVPSDSKSLSVELRTYRDLLHPVRISILQLLSQEYRVSRVAMTKLIGLSSGTISPHLDYLINKEVICRSQEFINEKPRIVYYMEQAGSSLYNDFKITIGKLLES